MTYPGNLDYVLPGCSLPHAVHRVFKYFQPKQAPITTKNTSQRVNQRTAGSSGNGGANRAKHIATRNPQQRRECSAEQFQLVVGAALRRMSCAPHYQDVVIGLSQFADRLVPLLIGVPFLDSTVSMFQKPRNFTLVFRSYTDLVTPH